MPTNSRESLSSRIGFIFLAAGCAIGLGNVWRFPYICGKYGGAYFVLIYLVCLAILGFPCLLMELAVGRAGQRTLPEAMGDLCQRAGLKNVWKNASRVIFAGNVVLLMFYSVVTGWLLKYTWMYLTGTLHKVAAKDIPAVFGNMLASPGQQILFTAIALLITLLVCFSGLQKGVERVTKFLMGGLLILMILQVIQTGFLPNASQGYSFFLKPNLATIKSHLGETIFNAMSQAFFTLSIGVGSMAIFGSYTNKTKSLSQESLVIILLDTFVAFSAGLIIFPCCAANNITADAGPALIFISLPCAFNATALYPIRAILFFLFLSAAAMTTLIAVAENIIAFVMERFHFNRRNASLVSCVGLFILSLPCIFGFNIWKNFQPFGKGSCVLDLEDFIISNNLLPLGALMIALFCTCNLGWGMDNFYEEANTGTGLKLCKCLKGYLKYVLPLIIFAIWLLGILQKFGVIK